MKYLRYIYVLLPFLIGCNVEPVEIIYGEDACDFCQMNIVDTQHAAELVSTKGRAYKFDAIECMMNYLNRKDIASSDMQLLLICDYGQPEVLIDATTATYIISENITSPMGAFLSGFETEEMALETIENKGGESFKWDELKERYKVK